MDKNLIASIVEELNWPDTRINLWLTFIASSLIAIYKFPLHVSSLLFYFVLFISLFLLISIVRRLPKRRYIGTLLNSFYQSLALGYGNHSKFLPGQIRRTLEKFRLGGKKAIYAYALFTNRSDYEEIRKALGAKLGYDEISREVEKLGFQRKDFYSNDGTLEFHWVWEQHRLPLSRSAWWSHGLGEPGADD